jgi:hypothetical protein
MDGLRQAAAPVVVGLLAGLVVGFSGVGQQAGSAPTPPGITTVAHTTSYDRGITGPLGQR